jgi:hypothetical protein
MTTPTFIDTSSEPPLMRPLVNIREDHARVTPGEAFRAHFDVQNAGTIVETYDLIALGPAAPWVEIDPPTLSLFPGEEGTALVTLRPPLSPSVVAGDYVIGVQAMSEVRRANASSDEMLVAVAPFYRFSTAIGRNSFSIRTKAKLLVQVSNEGNSTVTYRIEAEDPEGYLTVKPEEPTITLAPGESRWSGVLVKAAPRLIGTTFDTRAFTATITPITNADTGMPIVDPQTEDTRGSVLHKPLLRVRLGFFGRLVLLFGFLSLIAVFVVSRLLASAPPTTAGAPPVPKNVKAATAGPGQVVLTWDQSPGASNYTVYSLGPAGDPTTSGSSARTAVSTPPASVTSIALRTSATPSPSSDDAALHLTRPSPICKGCTEVANVDGGTTRYVVVAVAPGEACYRVAAKVEASQSLYSPQACAFVPDPNGVDVNGDGIADGIDTNGDGLPDTPLAGATASQESTSPAPCPPMETEAKPISTTSMAILWAPATAPPRGMSAPPLTVQASPSTRPGLSPTVDAATSKVCDPAATITGWTIQRKIFTGWSDVAVVPKAADTAAEVVDLSPATKYCFRMRAATAEGQSVYTKAFCGTTQEPATPDPTPTPSVSDSTPAPAPAPSATVAGGEPSRPAPADSATPAAS